MIELDSTRSSLRHSRLFLVVVPGALAFFVTVCNFSNSRVSAGTYVAEPTIFDLVERFPVADVSGSVRIIEPSMKKVHSTHLTGGWGTIQSNPDGESWVSSEGGNAIIDIPLVSPVPLRIRLTVSAPAFRERKEIQSISIRWNGTYIDKWTVPVAGETIEIEVPVEQCFHGLNRLELQPWYWIDDCGIRLSRVEVVSDTPGRHHASVPALVHDGAIIQTPDSVVSYFLRLPPEAVLVLEGELLGSSPGLEGTISVTWRQEGIQEEVLFSRKLSELRAGSTVSARIDLPESALPKFAAVSLSYSVDSPEFAQLDEPLEMAFRWNLAKIEGVSRRDEWPVPELIQKPYNIVVILFDALRADQTGPYGSTVVKTPNMDALARQGVTFTNAFANTPWSPTSVACLLTGRYNSSMPSVPMFISQSVPYLPAILKNRGYRTLAISHNPHISAANGFSRAFDVFHEFFRRKHVARLNAFRDPVERARYTWDSLIAPFLAEGDDGPFFIYLHEIDPHSPYTPPAPYDQLYDTGYRLAEARYPTLRNLVQSGRMRFSQADAGYYMSQYRGEISYMDAFLGKLLADLDRANLTEDTVLIFLADHGDEFMEHGRLGHSQSIFDEVMRVPLIMRLPGVIPQEQRAAVDAELVDVVPTVLQLLGAELPQNVQGKSLTPYFFAPEGYRPWVTTFAKSHERSDATSWDSVRLGNYKLIENKLGEDNRKDEWERALYNMVKDPDEVFNVWFSKPIIGKALHQALMWRLHSDNSLKHSNREDAEEEGVKPEDDPEVMERLRALGYL